MTRILTLPFSIVIAFIWMLALATALMLHLPFGRIGEWTWMKREVFDFSSIALASALFSLFAILGLICFANNKDERWVGINAFAIIVVLRFSFSALQGFQPASAFWALTIASPISTSFFTEAKQVEQDGVSKYLRHYHEELSSKPVHIATHPPGLPLLLATFRKFFKMAWTQKIATFFLDDRTTKTLQHLYAQVMQAGYGLNQRNLHRISLWELRSAWWISVICITFNIFTVGIWSWLLKQYSSTDTSAITIGLIATTPASLWWIPAIDSLHFLVTVGVLTSALNWQKTQSWFWSVMTGLLSGLAVWTAFKNAIPIICIVFWLVWHTKYARVKLHLALVGQWVLFVSLCVAPYVLSWLLYGFQPIETLRSASTSHHWQAGAHVRSYWWAVINLLDFAMGLGGAWLGLIAMHVWYWWHKERWQPSLTVVTLLVLLTLNLSGIIRGEVARLWLPFIPLLAMETVKQIPKTTFHRLLLVGIQSGIAIALHLHFEFLRPW